MAWINSSGKRVEAVSVTVQTYGPSPLRLRMAFRYRPAVDGRPLSTPARAVAGGTAARDAASKPRAPAQPRTATRR